MCDVVPETDPWERTSPSTMSAEVNELATALAKAQSEIKVAQKNATNPYFKSRYADLQGVWDCCRGPLTKNGLSVVMSVESIGTAMNITGTLLHSSGQWIKSTLAIMPTKGDPQGTLSALTYGRRGLLAAMVGVVPGDDDDGNYASGNTDTPPEAEKPVQPSPEPLDNPLDVSAVGRLAKLTRIPREDLTWWLADEGFIDTDEAGDPGPLGEDKLKWLLQDRRSRVEEPYLRFKTWVALIGTKRFPKKEREALRDYFVTRDQIDPSKAVKGFYPWSNLHPKTVELAAENWGAMLNAYKAHKEGD